MLGERARRERKKRKNVERRRYATEQPPRRKRRWEGGPEGLSLDCGPVLHPRLACKSSLHDLNSFKDDLTELQFLCPNF